MLCSPAVRIRKANGQVRQICTITSDQKLSWPISQNGRACTRCRSSSSWFTMPVSRWSMKFQVITEAKTGSAYGMRNRVRTAPRPRNARWVKTAAAMPNSQDTARTIDRVKDRDGERVQQRLADGRGEVHRDRVVADSPANGAARQFRR